MRGDDPVYVPPSIGGEDVEAAGREAGPEEAGEEDLQNGHPCHGEQRPEPHHLSCRRRREKERERESCS